MEKTNRKKLVGLIFADEQFSLISNFFFQMSYYIVFYLISHFTTYKLAKSISAKGKLNALAARSGIHL